MRIALTVIAGPHKGHEFSFGRHDTFLVGRSRHAHFRLPLKDKYFSRIHFMVEVNPPQCRIIDMGSHNGTYINGVKLNYADLKDGDQIRAGHTILKLAVVPEGSDVEMTTVHGVQEAALTTGIPGYKLARELGRGGMGVVYLALRLADKATVAVKTVAPKVGGSKAQIERLFAEARTLAELNYPYIVPLRDMGQAGGLLYFVMDFVPGKDAATLLKKDGPFERKRGVRLICQTLQALEYAHARNIVHRDIKPSNVLITEENGKEIAKLADFGLARVYQASQFSGLTVIGNSSGSAEFMPPELITSYRAAEPPADQYSAAATLYTMLTGKPVFDFPAEDHRRLSLILRAQPVPIQERLPDIQPRLAAVIHKALSRNPGQRFSDVTAFRLALAACG